MLPLIDRIRDLYLDTGKGAVGGLPSSARTLRGALRANAAISTSPAAKGCRSEELNTPSHIFLFLLFLSSTSCGFESARSPACTVSLMLPPKPCPDGLCSLSTWQDSSTGVVSRQSDVALIRASNELTAWGWPTRLRRQLQDTGCTFAYSVHSVARKLGDSVARRL